MKQTRLLEDKICIDTVTRLFEHTALPIHGYLNVYADDSLDYGIDAIQNESVTNIFVHASSNIYAYLEFRVLYPFNHAYD